MKYRAQNEAQDTKCSTFNVQVADLHTIGLGGVGDSIPGRCDGPRSPPRLVPRVIASTLELAVRRSLFVP